MRTRAAAAILLALAAGCGAGGAAAHESWLEPASFAIEHDRPVAVRVCVADGSEGWSLARDPERLARFVAIDEAGEVPVVGLAGSDPAGAVRLARPGDYVIAYESRRALLRVPAAEFEAFLQEKGLAHVVRALAARPSRAATVREAYSRHLKALVRVGADSRIPVDRPTGMALELIAETEAAQSQVVERTFRLLHRGRPLANALVVATRLGSADREARARTSADGRVRFLFREQGLWRIAAVHMLEAARGSGADWESLWTSLSLDLTAAGAWPSAKARSACANRLPPTASGTRS